jgi:hypothetical protein
MPSCQSAAAARVAICSNCAIGARAFLLGCLLFAGCSAEDVSTARAANCDAGECVRDPVLDGADPQTFCDDHNPCTEDANCTPCSSLPAGEHDIFHCTADDELPSSCAGKTGCVHEPLTTPAGQRNACFPVADAASLEAGVCDRGTCVANDSAYFRLFTVNKFQKTFGENVKLALDP